MFPHEQIRRDKDRSWSFKLVDAIASGQCDDLDEIEETLCELDDPRAASALLGLIQNSTLSDTIRLSASDAVCRLSTHESAVERMKWWQSGDNVLMRLAVKLADGNEREIVQCLASDRAHSLHLEAIEALQCWPEAKYQNLLVKALEHSDVKVRTSAASALKWEEPYRAESLLLTNATDADKGLVDTALYTLEWYKSRNVLLSLVQLKQEGPVEYRQMYCDSACGVVCSFIIELTHGCDEKIENKLAEWLKPVAHFLAKQRADEKEMELEEELAKAEDHTNDDSSPLASLNSVEKSRRIMLELDDANGQWSKKLTLLNLANWITIAPAEQKVLADYLSSHPDNNVKMHSCSALSTWGMADKLISLLDDCNWSVSRTAAYELRHLPQDKSIAIELWRVFKSDRATGSLATEAFDSFLKHAQEPGLLDTLIDLIEHEEQETIIMHALSEISGRNNAMALQSLSWLLQREPLVSWKVHTHYLDLMRDNESVNVDFSHLKETDDLMLQIATAQLA